MIKSSVPSAIKDIASKSDENSIYLKYTDKKIVAKRIFYELVKRLNLKDKGNKGFYMTDDKNDIGILSQCQSLQTLLELANNYGLDFDEKHKVSGEEVSIREIMDIVVEEVLNLIVDKETKNCVFDASPFAGSEQLVTDGVQYSYINSITWVIPTFLLVLKYHARIGEICKWEDDLINVINQGIKYINESYISGETGNVNKLNVGWNFTKDCEEPSLYFTYAVSDCLLQLYKTFETYISYNNSNTTVQALEQNEFYAIPEEIQKSFDRAKETYERDVNRQIKEFNEFGKKQAKFDEANELIRVLKKIDPAIENPQESLYYELNNKAKIVGEEIWRLTKEGLADNFYCNDLHSTISEEDIAMSTTNDALFNIAYIINTIINTGVDETRRVARDIAESSLTYWNNKRTEITNKLNEILKDFKDKESEEYKLALEKYNEEEQNVKEELEEIDANIRLFELKYKEASEKYNDILESCQLSIQRTFRVYDNFKKKSKEYIVDQFLVGFNEKFTKHQEITKELRKRRIRIFSLTPILITTYNAISEYLIKYPQSDMKKYLGYILENRYTVGKAKRWIWENDGFFSASNYYFVVALGEFYSYYETYEKSYSENFVSNEKWRKEFETKFEKDYQETVVKRKIDDNNAKHESDILELKKQRDAEIQARDEEIQKLKEQLAQVKTPIEDAVKVVINQELQKQLPLLLINFIKETNEALKNESNNVKAPEQAKEFKETILGLITALLYPMISASDKEEFIKDLNKDISKIMSVYFRQVEFTNAELTPLANFIENGKY